MIPDTFCAFFGNITMCFNFVFINVYLINNKANLFLTNFHLIFKCLDIQFLSLYTYIYILLSQSMYMFTWAEKTGSLFQLNVL